MSCVHCIVVIGNPQKKSLELFMCYFDVTIMSKFNNAQHLMENLLILPELTNLYQFYLFTIARQVIRQKMYRIKTASIYVDYNSVKKTKM